MKRMVLLPLDERPCNYEYPRLLFEDNARFSVTLPDPAVMPDKKAPADFEAVRGFLFDACDGADCLVVSLETLLYGGLLPSRLHNLSFEALMPRLAVLKELKEKYPALTIYALGLIMRCPQYSSSDEEPDYYGRCGKEIFELGVCRDKGETGDRVKALEAKVGADLNDYLSRRAVNLRLLLEAVGLVGDAIDFMVIPQDDSAPFGWTAADQRRVRAAVTQQGKALDCLIYPGADEAGLTLLTRYVNTVCGAPRVSVDYSSCAAARVVPLYEDRPLGESVKMQLCAAGCLRAGDEFGSDFTLMINAPSGKMLPASEASSAPEYRTERSLPEFVHKIAGLRSAGVRVAVADVAYVNGADLELAAMLDRAGLALGLAAYAGWNTSSNTLGTAIAQASIAVACGESAAHRRFLAHRYFEDAGYCAYARKEVCERFLPGLKLNYFDAGDRRGRVAAIVQETIEEHMRTLMPTVAAAYIVEDCRMPWARMFEVGLKIKERDGAKSIREEKDDKKEVEN